MARFEIVLQDRSEAVEQRSQDIRAEQDGHRGPHGDARQITRKQSGNDRDAAEWAAVQHKFKLLLMLLKS